MSVSRFSMGDMSLRALMPDDAETARALILSQLGGTSYEARAVEQLEAALSFEDAEYMGALAFPPDPDAPCGLVLFGTVAGALGVVKIHALFGTSSAACDALVSAVQRVAENSRERMIVAEVADDETFQDTSTALEACGFVETGRVADFVRDGVAMRLLVWRAADPHLLARFVQAQSSSYDEALSEIRASQKRSHWMWYIFPQVDGLGQSATARQFSIKSLAEAEAYLRHPVLGPRLMECAEALLCVRGRTAHEIFGFPDDAKLRSSATLFARVAPEGSPFHQILDRFFAGQPDRKTLALLGIEL